MQHRRYRLAKGQISQEPVTMRSQHHQVQFFLTGNADEFLGRVAKSKDSLRLEIFIFQVLDQVRHARAVGSALLVVRR